jgi:hypothetical protein
MCDGTAEKKCSTNNKRVEQCLLNTNESTLKVVPMNMKGHVRYA